MPAPASTTTRFRLGAAHRPTPDEFDLDVRLGELTARRPMAVNNRVGPGDGGQGTVEPTVNYTDVFDTVGCGGFTAECAPLTQFEQTCPDTACATAPGFTCDCGSAECAPPTQFEQTCPDTACPTAQGFTCDGGATCEGATCEATCGGATCATCDQFTCPEADTCQNTCGDTCITCGGHTCVFTCDLSECAFLPPG